MQCAEFERRLQTLLDRRRAPGADPRLAAHLEECAECRELVATYDTLLGGLAAAGPPQPAANLSERVVAQFTRSEQRTAKGTRLSWLAVAASLLLAAGWTISFSFRGTDSFPGSIPIQPAAPPTAVLDSEHLVPDRAVAIPTELHHAHPGAEPDEYLTVIRRTGWAMAKLPATVRRVTQTAEVTTLTDPIRPVANSMSAVLDALRRTLPSKPEPDSKS